MKRFAINLRMPAAAAAVLALTFTLPSASLMAQDQEKIASIHGHVNNAAGGLIPDATVRLTTGTTTDPKTAKWSYTFPVNAQGDFTGTGIDTTKTYIAVVYVQDKTVDFFPQQSFKPGEDKLVNFDMTRKEYIDKMSPEDKKTLEEYKKKNAAITAGNAKIANLNATLQQARADNKAGNFDAALTAMQQATTQAPTESILWVTLADAQLGLAEAAAKAGKAAGKAATDPDILQKYTDAETSYKKAIELDAASKKPNPSVAAAADNELGRAYAHSGDVKQASDSYDSAAKIDPPPAGMYFFNESVVLYNSGKTPEAAAAADKAIAAEPTRAEAYYIKGQALIPGASVDPKTQKITAPPGCVEAYQKYLELAPDGPHAEEVKGILTGIGATVQSSYKAKKK
jgi:tetratricopeptide (TPR) repeat protein